MLGLEFPPLGHIVDWPEFAGGSDYGINKVILVYFFAVVLTMLIFILGNKKQLVRPAPRTWPNSCRTASRKAPRRSPSRSPTQPAGRRSGAGDDHGRHRGHVAGRGRESRRRPADDEREERERETEEERRQRERTNQGNKDDDSVEGDVIETRCDQEWPSVVIANRDGAVEVKLVKEAQKACNSISVGDYLEADGEKQHEYLFHADSVEIKRRR